MTSVTFPSQDSMPSSATNLLAGCTDDVIQDIQRTSCQLHHLHNIYRYNEESSVPIPMNTSTFVIRLANMLKATSAMALQGVDIGGTCKWGESLERAEEKEIG